MATAPPGHKVDSKFESDDLPKIHAFLHKARIAGAPGRVIIEFSSNGGVVAIKRELTENAK